MAAVDTPPGLGLPGAQVGSFHARRGPGRLATRGFLYCLVVGALAIAVTGRRLGPDQVGARLTVVVTAIVVCAVAVAVRQARIGIARDGVRWGWGSLSVRLAAARIASVRLYRDAIVVAPRRGSTWYLFRRDWDGFEAMRRAIVSAGLAATDLDRPAPWTARLQSYGRVVDALVVGCVVAVTIVAGLALGA